MYIISLITMTNKSVMTFISVNKITNICLSVCLSDALPNSSKTSASIGDGLAMDHKNHRR